MKLKIKITVPDDRKYRDVMYPYDLYVTDLVADIDEAVRSTLRGMQEIDALNAESVIRRYGSRVGTLRVALE